ncbi:MAG: hypothetical protein KJO83_08290 [Bacteroidia bacterium]|nr:hypothetical protein [Bacteroidia bacterium]
MKKFIQFIILISALWGYSQSNFLTGADINNSSASITNYNSGTYLKTGGSKTISKVKGTPYLFDDWNNISVVTTLDDQKFKIVNLNYDTKSDLFVAKISQDSVFMFKPNYLKEVTINNRRFKKYLNQETALFNYYEVIAANDNTEILKRNQKVLRIGITNRLTMEKESDYFILKEDYYLNKSGNLTELSIKKKNILKLFGNKSQSVKKYISDNKLSIKEDVDLRKIFNYYESLM